MVESYYFKHGNHFVQLIDTPGFDDTHKSDADILQKLSVWLAASYSARTKLTGIIYLHRVSDNRMQGTALMNLGMFKKLCGD